MDAAVVSLSHPTLEQGSGQPYRWRWWALATVLAAEVMDLLDTTIIVNVSAPSIRNSLGGPTPRCSG